MLWVPDLIDKLLRDIFNYDSGWSASKTEFLNLTQHFSDFVSDIIEYLKKFANLFFNFTSFDISFFFCVILIIWVIIIIARVVKGFLGG